MGIHYNKGAELLDFVKNKEDFNMEGGFFKPLTKPGLGVEIDEEKVIALSKMPRTGATRCGDIPTVPSRSGDFSDRHHSPGQSTLSDNVVLDFHLVIQTVLTQPASPAAGR